MKKNILIILALCISYGSFAQKNISYTLRHTANSNKIEIEIEFDSVNTSTAKLIIPRSGPGTYELTNYLAFVTHVKGFTTFGKELHGTVGEGSYFMFKEKNQHLLKVTYEVDLNRMETTLLSGSASSKSRVNYLGLLGYSVFGFVEGFENEPINLTIEIDDTWPIFSTLRPSFDRKKGKDTYKVGNFALLADAQYLFGDAVKIFEVKDSKIPFFVAAYFETPINLEEIGRRGLVALNGLDDYFGYIPMPHYTMFYEFINPISDRHDYGFNMEHLNSMSSTNTISKAITSHDPNAKIGSIVHHMGHSWIPLRSYGTGYRPFEWQTAPLIETIWLNEGFIWYISYYSILDFKPIIDRFKNTTNFAPDYIKRKSLKDLSLLGSTQYVSDFRIGRNLFSRGALLAHDLDVFIQKETKGQKSFKDALLGLLKWTEINKEPFEYDKIEPIMSEATGVDLNEIWNKWQDPLKE